MPRSPQRWQSATDSFRAVRRKPDCPRGSSEVHSWHDVHSGPKLEIAILSFLDDDLYGDSLHDLDVIARGILRRKQAEKRARRSGDAVHVALVGPPVGIDVKLYELSGAHEPKLRLLEVGGDPDFFERDNREQLLARLNIHSNHHGLGHLSRHRGNDFRIAKVQFGLFESRLFLLHNG